MTHGVLKNKNITKIAHCCTEAVLKIMDAGYCLYVHIFVFFCHTMCNFWTVYNNDPVAEIKPEFVLLFQLPSDVSA